MKNPTDQRASIMIVDDSPEDIHLLLEQIKDDYRVMAASSGEDALSFLDQHELPDIMLLDVNMPGLSGFETCKKIKADKKFSGIDVIFLSANDSTAEILTGLDVGATDYLVKPYAQEILISKIRGALEARSQRDKLAQSASAANQIARIAMSDSGYLGSVVACLRAGFLIENETDLSDLLIDTLEEFGLSASVLLKTGIIETARSTTGEPGMLELELLRRSMVNNTPFTEHRDKLIVVKRNIAVLINNTPEDKDQFGRIKDYMMILLEGVNASLDHLLNKLMIEQVRESDINKIVLTAESSLLEIQALQEQHKRRSVEIVDDMVGEVERNFFSLDLTIDQEEKLLTIMSSTSAKALDHFEHGVEIDHSVNDVIHSLSTAVSGIS